MLDQGVHPVARAAMRDIRDLGTDVDHGIALQHAKLEIIEMQQLHRERSSPSVLSAEAYTASAWRRNRLVCMALTPGAEAPQKDRIASSLTLLAMTHDVARAFSSAATGFPIKTHGVILRRSPSSASLEGWPRTPPVAILRGAQGRAPQDDGGMCGQRSL
jgi:hypothetical protein